MFVGLAFGLRVAGFRINLSVSHPLGFYRVVDQEPAVGLYALFCVPVPLADLPPVDQTRSTLHPRYSRLSHAQAH